MERKKANSLSPTLFSNEVNSIPNILLAFSDEQTCAVLGSFASFAAPGFPTGIPGISGWWMLNQSVMSGSREGESKRRRVSYASSPATRKRGEKEPTLEASRTVRYNESVSRGFGDGESFEMGGGDWKKDGVKRREESALSSSDSTEEKEERERDHSPSRTSIQLMRG